MRKLYHLDESEKERILNMHKEATKKHYLVEGKSYLFEDVTTPQSTVRPTQPLNFDIEKIPEPPAETNSAWPFITVVGLVVSGGIVYSLRRKIFPENVRKAIRKVYDVISYPVKSGYKILFPPYNKAVAEMLQELEKSKIMTKDGFVYYIDKLVNDPNNSNIQRAYINKINIREYFTKNIKAIRQGKKPEKMAKEVEDMGGKPIIDSDQALRLTLAMREEDLTRAKYLEYDKFSKTVTDEFGNPIAGTKLETFDQSISIASKEVDIRTDFEAMKSRARLARVRDIPIGLLTLAWFGYLDTAISHVAVQPAAWWVYTLLRDNTWFLGDWLKQLVEGEDPKIFVNKLCNVPPRFKEALAKFEELDTMGIKKSNQDISKLQEELLTLYKQNRFDAIKNIFKNKLEVYDIINFADYKGKCFYDELFKTFKSNHFSTLVRDIITKKFDDWVSAAESALNLTEFWNKVGDQKATKIETPDTPIDTKLSDIPRFNDVRNNIMRNCPCGFYKVLADWKLGEEQVSVSIVEKWDPIKQETNKEDNVWLFTNGTLAVSDKCQQYQWQEYVQYFKGDSDKRLDNGVVERKYLAKYKKDIEDKKISIEKVKDMARKEFKRMNEQMEQELNKLFTDEQITQSECNAFNR